jgi:thiamine biosynthesis lipoprotein ApbE
MTASLVGPASPASTEARWMALGTTVHLLVTDAAALEAARASVERTLDEVDTTYSRFREDSELRRLAAHRGTPVRVSELLARAVEAALRAARETDGAVDPTVGRAMRAIGYEADFSVLATLDGPIHLRLQAVPGWPRVRLDLPRRMLQVPVGVELDLGSTGKALAADLAADAALAAARAAPGASDEVGILVNLGGDIATAGAVPPEGWRVLATDDARSTPDGPGEVVALHGGALATSSTTVRRWARSGVELHHIVDPSTGLPVRSPWRTASVAAATCVDANAAATAAIVRGAVAPAWLARLGLPARLVSTTGDVVRVGGWPAATSSLDAGPVPVALEIAS